jgi:hypothetical protein
MYNPSNVVGDYFEDYACRVFGLDRTDPKLLGNVPDLMAKDGSFFVECKVSSFKNGGVVKGEQLFRFDREISVKRFYVFIYHPVCEKMEDNYPTERKLRNAFDRSLNLVQVYLFPLSIVLAHYAREPKSVKYPGRSYEVQFCKLKYKQAQGIYRLDPEMFSTLSLDPKQYQQKELHERVHVLTRQGHLEDKLVGSFHLESL